MSGSVPLAPVLDPSGETVLWSSVPPAPDAKAAAAAATAAAAAAAVNGAAGNGVRFAVPDLEDSTASVGSGKEQGQQLWDPDLFNDPQLPPPIKVTVKAGEALYLPAMWWHHVSWGAEQFCHVDGLLSTCSGSLGGLSRAVGRGGATPARHAMAAREWRFEFHNWRHALLA